VALIIAALLLYREARTATDNVNRVADPILILCRQGGETAEKLNDAGLCGTAAAIKENPSIVTERPVDDGHIIELIDAELAKRPVSVSVAPNMGQLIDAARAVISSNPDAFRGPAGTPAPSTDLAAAVSAYVSSHQASFQGPPGTPGQPGNAGQPGQTGQPGQPGQVGAQGPAGPAGPQGPAGEQGAAGETGPAGPAGADGGSCPSGTAFAPVTFADGRTGQACVDDGSGATTTTEPSAPTDSSSTGDSNNGTTTDTPAPIITVLPDPPTGATDSPGLTIPLPLLGR
jgi:hypothetical protein